MSTTVLSETPYTIVTLTMAHLTKSLKAHDIPALKALVEQEAYKARVLAMDTACLRGDLEQTKVAGRALITFVKKLMGNGK